MGLDATFYRTVPASNPRSADEMQTKVDFLRSCNVYDSHRVTSVTEAVYDFRKFNGLERFMKTHKLHRQVLNEGWLNMMERSADRAINKADELCVVVEDSDGELDTRDCSIDPTSEYAKWSLQHNPLRPMPGFFFGSTDYTSIYFNHLQKLMSVCRSMSQDIESGNALYYTYESSW
jgi:hypothetical protein